MDGDPDSLGVLVDFIYGAGEVIFHLNGVARLILGRHLVCVQPVRGLLPFAVFAVPVFWC